MTHSFGVTVVLGEPSLWSVTIHIHTYINICMYAYTYIYMYIYIHTHISDVLTNTRHDHDLSWGVTVLFGEPLLWSVTIHIHTFTNICMHIHIYTCTYIHIHIYQMCWQTPITIMTLSLGVTVLLGEPSLWIVTIQIHTYMHISIYTYIHTYIYILMHISAVLPNTHHDHEVLLWGGYNQ